MTRGGGGGRLDGMVLAFWVTTQQTTNKPTNKQSGRRARQEAKMWRKDRGEAASSHVVCDTLLYYF
jgi:hypothetical protein